MERPERFLKNLPKLKSCYRRLFCFDEGRFGLKTWFRKRWCTLGNRPPFEVDDRYEWVWVYVAVEPCSGETFFSLLPNMTGDALQIFLEELQDYTSTTSLGLIGDNAPSHRSQQVKWPKPIDYIALPAYSPELNPAECIFKHLRGKLSNRVFESIEALEETLLHEIKLLQQHPEQVTSLTHFSWWKT